MMRCWGEVARINQPLLGINRYLYFLERYMYLVLTLLKLLGLRKKTGLSIHIWVIQ